MVTANVASQLRSFSSFDVGAGTRVDGPIGHSLMVADRLDLSRLAVVAIISVGLSPGVADDVPCLARVNALGDAFRVAVMGLRAHTFSNYSMLSVPDADAVLCDMVNRDIALWVSELTRAAQRSSPAVVPHHLARCSTPRPCPLRAHSRILPRRGGGGPARNHQHRLRRRPVHQAKYYRFPRWVVRVRGKGHFKSPPGLPDVRAHR